MKRSYLLAMALTTLAGCAASLPPQAGSGAPDEAPTSAPPFAYRIDPIIAERYGTHGEVGWQKIGSGHRPGIYLFDETYLQFSPLATARDRERFSQDFQVVSWRNSGPDPNVYLVTFRTEAIPLEGLERAPGAFGTGGSWVFSSEKAAKLFHQFFRIKKQAAAYNIKFVGLNRQMCVPEDCGPDGGPEPSYAPLLD